MAKPNTGSLEAIGPSHGVHLHASGGIHRHCVGVNRESRVCVNKLSSRCGDDARWSSNRHAACGIEHLRGGSDHARVHHHAVVHGCHPRLHVEGGAANSGREGETVEGLTLTLSSGHGSCLGRLTSGDWVTIGIWFRL